MCGVVKKHPFVWSHFVYLDKYYATTMKRLLFTLLPLLTFGQTSFEELIENTSLNVGLIQCYPFSGSANDISGNNLHGEAINVDLTTDRFGSTNSAYNFDYSHTTFGGQGDEVFIPYDPIMSTQFLTVSVWLKPNSYYWTGDSGTATLTILGRIQFVITQCIVYI